MRKFSLILYPYNTRKNRSVSDVCELYRGIACKNFNACKIFMKQKIAS